MSATHNLRSPFILVVDDVPANALLLVRMLTDRGYDARAVNSGELALQAARTNPPELILLDIHMPHMNGFQVCEQLKLDPVLREIPVIFISALHEECDKMRAFGVGGVDYVTKPFQLSEVHARVATHLKLRSLQRQLSEHNTSLQEEVAQATQALTESCLRVRELSRLKDEFFDMISHEMRTPANGVLGLGELLINLCPESDKRTRYAALFAKSSDRLVNLLNDVTLIGNMATCTTSSWEDCRFSDLLVAVLRALPGMRITLDNPVSLKAMVLKGSEPLLQSVLKTAVILATCFAADKARVQLVCTFDDERLQVRLALDSLSLSGEQVADFFKIGSSARSESTAERMGLAPVVACQTLGALGGELSLVKGAGTTGYLAASFLRARALGAGDSV